MTQNESHPQDIDGDLICNGRLMIRNTSMVSRNRPISRSDRIRTANSNSNEENSDEKPKYNIGENQRHKRRQDPLQNKRPPSESMRTAAASSSLPHTSVNINNQRPDRFPIQMRESNDVSQQCYKTNNTEQLLGRQHEKKFTRQHQVVKGLETDNFLYQNNTPISDPRANLSGIKDNADDNASVSSEGKTTPRLSASAARPKNQRNSPIDNSPNKYDLISRQEDDVDQKPAIKSRLRQGMSTEGDFTPAGNEKVKGSIDTTINRLKNRSSSVARSASLDRPQNMDNEKKLQKLDKGPPVCVCSAAAYYERERINMERKKSQLKEEAEALRADIKVHRQQKQQLTELYQNVQSAEQCLKIKEEALKSREDVIREDELRLEQRDAQLSQERNEVEELRSRISLREKDLEISIKRYEREQNDLKAQADALKKENLRVNNLGEILNNKEAEITREERRLTDLRNSLEDKRLQFTHKERELEDRESKLTDAELEEEEREARLQRLSEDLKIKEDCLNQQRVELENLKAVNEKFDYALKNKSAQLDQTLNELETKQHELDRKQELFSKERVRLETEFHLQRTRQEEEYIQKMTRLSQQNDEIEKKANEMEKRESALKKLESELNDRDSNLQTLQQKLEHKTEEAERQKIRNGDVESELQRRSEFIETEKQKSLMRQKEIEKNEAENLAMQENLLRGKENLKKREAEFQKKEIIVEKINKEIEHQKKNLDLRELALQNEEKNSEWYQIITQDIADQREHYDLQMQNFEVDKQAFIEMKAVWATNCESTNKALKAREEALARLELELQERVKEVHRQETVLETRLLEEPNLKHKLLTVSRPSDNPVLRQTDRSYQASSPFGSTQQKSFAIPINDGSRPNSYRASAIASNRTGRPGAVPTGEMVLSFKTGDAAELSSSKSLVDEAVSQYGGGSSSRYVQGEFEVRKKKNTSRKRGSSKSTRRAEMSPENLAATSESIENKGNIHPNHFDNESDVKKSLQMSSRNLDSIERRSQSARNSKLNRMNGTIPKKYQMLGEDIECQNEPSFISEGFKSFSSDGCIGEKYNKLESGKETISFEDNEMRQINGKAVQPIHGFTKKDKSPLLNTESVLLGRINQLDSPSTKNGFLSQEKSRPIGNNLENENGSPAVVCFDGLEVKFNALMGVGEEQGVSLTAADASCELLNSSMTEIMDSPLL